MWVRGRDFKHFDCLSLSFEAGFNFVFGWSDGCYVYMESDNSAPNTLMRFPPFFSIVERTGMMFAKLIFNC